MNRTLTHVDDDSNPVFVYLLLAIEMLTCVLSLITGYKLGHFTIKSDHIKCCCFEFDGLDIEVSDDEIIAKR